MTTDITTDRRDRYAEALALHLNGPASDGRGWYRTEADRIDCFALADVALAVRDAELDAAHAELARLRTKLAEEVQATAQAEKRAEYAEGEHQVTRERYDSARQSLERQKAIVQKLQRELAAARGGNA